MTKKHLKQYSKTARKLRIRELNDKDAVGLQYAARFGDCGPDPYAVNQEFRELIEEKSRFIPKIFGDIE